ncbi:hypothetical protein [Acidithiobacillus sp.]
MGWFSGIFGTNRAQPAGNLWIGADPEHLQPVDDPEGLGGYQLAIDKLIREEAPERIYVRSGDPGDLSMVRKALEYLSYIGGEVGVAEQIPEAEVAEIFGVDTESYRAAVADPNGDAGAHAG